MSLKHLNFVIVVAALFITWEPQACSTQFFRQRNVPLTGSISRANSVAAQRQLNLGGLGLSRGIVDARTVTKSNGGAINGGTTSISNSRSRTGEVNIGGLGIGSSLTSSQTRTNGAVSRSLAHDLNIGGLGIGTSLSRDNLRNGFGLQHSQNGGLQLGLGLLNIDLSKNRQQQHSQAITQAQAQAQGLDAHARSNSNSATYSQQFGGIGVTDTLSRSNSISSTTHGQTSAAAGGLAGGSTINNNRFRARPFPLFTVPQRSFLRSKREAPFIPVTYPALQFVYSGHRLSKNIGFHQPNYHFGLAQKQNENTFEHQALQNKGASSAGSKRSMTFTNDEYQNMNNARCQSLNYNKVQQNNINTNVGTEEIILEKRVHFEGHSGSLVTNNNKFGISGNAPHTHSVVCKNADTVSSFDNSSSQSIVQDHNGEISAAGTDLHVNSSQRLNGYITNTGSRNASDVSHGAQTVNAFPTSNLNGGTNSNAGSFDGFDNDGGGGIQGNSQSKFQAFKLRQRKFTFYTPQPQRQQQNQTSSPTLEMRNDSTEINWPKNCIQQFTQRHQLPRQRKQQPQKIYPQQLHYSSINSNSSTEQFTVIDEKVRHGRTFTFITDLINSFTEPTCIYPCTLDAYQQGRCCETAVVASQSPSNVCCQQLVPPLPVNPIPPLTTIVHPPILIPPTRLQPLPTLTFPLPTTPCCNFCLPYGYYGPPSSSCIRYTFPIIDPGRVTLCVD